MRAPLPSVALLKLLLLLFIFLILSQVGGGGGIGTLEKRAVGSAGQAERGFRFDVDAERRVGLGGSALSGLV